MKERFFDKLPIGHHNANWCQNWSVGTQKCHAMPRKIPDGAPRKTAPRKPLDAWDKAAQRVLNVEMMRKEQTPATLASTMVELGYVDTPKALAQRISRGSFNFGFALRALRSMGVESLDISYVKVYKKSRRELP